MRRRKTVYPHANRATKGGSPTTDARLAAASRLVSIDVAAIRGRSGFLPGMLVEVTGGLHSGARGVVESVAGGVIPAVAIRTETGHLRRVRAVDLASVPVRPEDPTPSSR